MAAAGIKEVPALERIKEDLSAESPKKVQNATRVAKNVIGADNAPKQTVLIELDHRVMVPVHPELDSMTNQQISIT